MSKFIKNDGTPIPFGTVLFDGKTNTNFTLSDDISNYDYLEIYYSLHSWVGQKSTKIALSASKRAHLSGVHRGGNDIYVYEIDMKFSGNKVTISGCTKMIGGTLIENIEGSIYKVVGY